MRIILRAWISIVASLSLFDSDTFVSEDADESVVGDGGRTPRQDEVVFEHKAGVVKTRTVREC